jgi:hypothetical protein
MICKDCALTSLGTHVTRGVLDHVGNFFLKKKALDIPQICRNTVYACKEMYKKRGRRSRIRIERGKKSANRTILVRELHNSSLHSRTWGRHSSP